MNRRIQALAAGILAACLLELTACGSYLRIRPEGGISRNLAILQNSGEIRSIDMETGETRVLSPAAFSAAEGTYLLIAQNGPEQTEVYAYDNGTETHLFSTPQYIWQQPVMVEQCVYFIAAETNEERNGLLLNDAYIWTYRDGVIQKLCSTPVHPYSGIQRSGRSVLYVEEASDCDGAPFRIVRLDTETGETERLSAGQYPCWKEDGASFFFGTPDGNLAVYDLSSQAADILWEALELRKTPVYNETDQVLLLCHTDTSFPKSVDVTTDSLLYLQENALRSYRAYFQEVFGTWEAQYSCQGVPVWIS
ncbi:MAG: hypothetical protein ACI4V1_08030 [Eubacteriales bacterium]